MIVSLTFNACVHDPVIMDIDPDPMDTMPDDTIIVENPCEPGVVYFENDILPLILGNCAIVDCHDVISQQDGVFFSDYDNIMENGDIEPFDLDDSDLYELITEDDPDKRMPPTGKLSSEQINLIATWILQGAENNFCEDIECDSVDMNYIEDISPILELSCNGCHSSSVASGGVVTDNYSDILIVVQSGQLSGAINWDDGYTNMPFNQSKLDDCTINKINNWINDGAPEN